VTCEWRAIDRMRAAMMRLGLARGRSTVLPGLYAVGSPDAMSAVLVTANSKPSFDVLRRVARGLDAWILVLETRGHHVGSAVSESNSGGDELARRIEEVELSRVVVHRRLIVSRVGSPGVEARELAMCSDFEVVWGPVKIDDLADLVAAGPAAVA
jgi:CO dehydrogenase/acetyl-CoA synthase gamma subunit (corrinoid Fe-S protein)